MVVVCVLLTIFFHGMNDNFVVAVNWGVPFALFVIVMLVATAVTVNSLSLSLLFVFCFLVGLDNMMVGLSLEGQDEVSSILLSFVVGVAGV